MAMRSSSGATPPKTRITRIRVSMVQGRFHKFVAMNAYDLAPKGHTYENPLIRIETRTEWKAWVRERTRRRTPLTWRA